MNEKKNRNFVFFLGNFETMQKNVKEYDKSREQVSMRS